MKAATREWLGKAEDDYRPALQVARGSEPFHDQLCFHCQQSAEKHLKALFEEAIRWAGIVRDACRARLGLKP